MPKIRSKKQNIYLDHAGSSHILPEALKEMVDVYKQSIGNSLALHEPGRKAKEILQSARGKMAGIISCLPEEIIFTSGGTESNNLALFGIARAYKDRFKKPRIISSQIEHATVLNCLKKLEKEGFEIKLISVDKKGFVDLKELEKNINSQTILVSIMAANNEIGTIQDLKKIADIIKKKKREMKSLDSRLRGNDGHLFFHTDASSNFLNFKNIKSQVDLMTLNGGKIGGPKGTSALYIKKGIKISSLMLGAGQEDGRRAGTENIPGIAGFAKALEINQKNLNKNIKKVSRLRDFLIKSVLRQIPMVYLSGDRKKRLANNASFIIPEIEGESLVLMLDREGIFVSTGSACQSRSLKPSHVLSAMGLPLEIIHGSLRVALGEETTKKEIIFFVEKLKEAVLKLREISAVNSFSVIPAQAGIHKILKTRDSRFRGNDDGEQKI